MKKSVEDKAAADSASAKISAIGTVEYSAESKKKINDAAVAYNALTAEQKALVDNHATLAAAQAKYDELKAAAENPESPTPISELSATVTAPVGGEHPSFTVTVPDGAHYTAVVYAWYDLNNNGAHLTNSDTFVTGNEYQARIHFTANTGYEINSASYTINGTPNYASFDTAEQRGMKFVATAPAKIPGDVNGDGKINLMDVSVILRYIAKWGITVDIDTADVNDDSRVNLNDASLILKYIAKWDGIVLK